MRVINILGIFVLLVFTAACGPNLRNIGKESDPTRFYTLTSSIEMAEENLPANTRLKVGVGPVAMADYLNRSHIVVRKSQNRLDLADFDRWAAAPEKEIKRVVAANLAVLLGTDQIVQYPWKLGMPLDASVEISMERFELAADGKVHLVATWQVYKNESRVADTFRRTALSKPADANYESIVKALSELTGELSVLISAAILRG